MSDFPLIHSLEHPSEKKNKFPSGHKYTEREVIVENRNFTVFVPTREIPTFDERMSQNTEVSYDDFKMILRDVRGIRGDT